jgi:hypothetical protein
MKKVLNFIIVCLTTFLISLLLSTTVYAGNGLSIPSPSPSPSLTLCQSPTHTLLSLSTFIPLLAAALTATVTFWNGFNPRSTLKSDIELREKLIHLSFVEIKLIEDKINHDYNHLYRRRWVNKLLLGIFSIFFAFSILFFLPDELLKSSIGIDLRKLIFLVFFIIGITSILRSCWKWAWKWACSRRI